MMKGTASTRNPVTPSCQPEAHDLPDLLLHRRVLGVEVGLERIEAVVVVGARLLVVGPGGLLHAGKHHPLVRPRRLLLRPVVVVPEPRVLVLAGRLEPGVLVRGVVDDQIDDHPDAALACLLGELDEVAGAAVAAIDAVVVQRVVAVVVVGRGLERLQPQGGHAQAGQVVQPAQQALEVATAVAVGVHERADVQAIEDGVLVPEVVDHRSLAAQPAPAEPGRAAPPAPPTADRTGRSRPRRRRTRRYGPCTPRRRRPRPPTPG